MTDDLQLHGALIGRAAVRARLNTPVLIVDREALDRNIARMADGDGAPAGTTHRFMGDEHGAIVDPASRHAWQPGDLVRLAVPHCDPTVTSRDPGTPAARVR